MKKPKRLPKNANDGSAVQMTGRNHKFTKCALAALLAAVMLPGQTAVLPVSAAEAANVPDSGLPVLYVNIDEDAEGYGTVEEMNASPGRACTRAELVTLLWRSQYEPSPEDPESPFTDVAPGSYYSEAVLWAAEQGRARGTGSGLFQPLRVCRRADAVTFVFRAAAQE